MRESIRNARRFVIKLGTSTLAPGGKFDRPHLTRLCHDLVTLIEEGRQLVVVSSGAIALGVEKLGWPERPTDIPRKQAAAAVGQSILMERWHAALSAFEVKVAQVLLTHDDVSDRRRYLNARRALSVLLSEGIVPVINENDTVSVEEIKFGDNDTLAGLIVSVVDADALVMLSDVDGLYSGNPNKDPRAKLLTTVEHVTPEIEAMATGAGSKVGTGGMITKVQAAKGTSARGVPTVIASGRRRSVILDVARGEEIGTYFAPQEESRRGLGSNAYLLEPKGTLELDEAGIKAALERRDVVASAVGVVKGHFEAGDPIALAGRDGRAIALGLCRYSANELRRIIGKKGSSEIETALGYKDSDQVVHGDDIVELA